MTKPVYFISDIHLGLESFEKEQKKEALLVSFLQSIAGKASELYIVGDLFDYWFEYKRVYQKGYFRTLTALADVVQSGVTVHYIIGNHDFMHRDFFEKHVGLQLCHGVIRTEIAGKRFFIAHGDGLVANDLGYKILKKILRNRAAQWLFSFIHPDLGIAIASHSSKTSREYTSKKDYGEQDSMFIAAHSYIENGFDFVIFGHSHVRMQKQYRTGMYINLGTWLDRPCYGVYQDNEFKILDWTSNGK